MKKLFTLILIAGCAVANAQVINIDEPSTYIPAEISGVKIGMGIQDFHKINDTTKLSRIANYGYLYIQFNQTTAIGNLISVNYKFDTPQKGVNPNRPLYEMTFTFKDVESADKFVAEKFTAAYRTSQIAEKEWFLSTNKDYWILIRKTGPTVMFAAMMSGTEWGFE